MSETGLNAMNVNTALEDYYNNWENLSTEINQGVILMLNWNLAECTSKF